MSNGIKKILSDRREVPSRRDLDGNFFTMWRERVYIYINISNGESPPGVSFMLNFLIRRLNSVEISTAREEDLLRKQNSSDEI